MKVMGDHQKLSEALVHDILEKAERDGSVQPGEARSKETLLCILSEVLREMVTQKELDSYDAQGKDKRQQITNKRDSN